MKERCSDVQFQPPTIRDVIFFQLRGLITKSCGVTLPVTEMMATRRLQTRTIFRQPARRTGHLREVRRRLVACLPVGASAKEKTQSLRDMHSTLKAVEKDWRMIFDEELANLEIDLGVRSRRVEWCSGAAMGPRFCWPRRDVIFRAGAELGIKVNLHTSRCIWCLVWRTSSQVLQCSGWLRCVHDNMGVDGDWFGPV